MNIRDKNWSEICISSPWDRYSCSVRYYVVVHVFWCFKTYRILSQKPKGLAFGFTEKRMFAVKTSWKFVFHPHEAYNLSRLDASMLYINFWGFEKYWASAQNPKRVSLQFYWKCMFTMKTGWKSVFHPRGAHIIARLDIMLLYINFF
jgi:hypothetical protein